MACMNQKHANFDGCQLSAEVAIDNHVDKIEKDMPGLCRRCRLGGVDCIWRICAIIFHVFVAASRYNGGGFFFAAAAWNV